MASLPTSLDARARMTPSAPEPARSGRAAALRNAGWLLGDKAIALLAGLLVFGLIGRRYGPEIVGHFAFAVALLQTTLGLAQVCSGAFALPRLCRLRAGRAAAIANVMTVRVLGSLLATAAIAGYALLTIGTAERQTIALLLVAAALLMEPAHAAVMHWQARNDNRPQALVRSAALLVRLGIVALVIAVDGPLWLIAAAWLLEAAVFASLFLALWLREIDARAAWRAIRGARVSAYLRHGLRFLPGLWLSHLFLRIDRLALAERMPAHDYGIYAAAMQLVEVWLQVAQILALAMGPAFLFAAIDRRLPWRAYARPAAALALLGLAGLAGAWLLGGPLMQLVFGPAFAGSAAFLVAGAAFGVLFFVDQLVQMQITTRGRPGLLALRWAVAAVVALAAQLALYPRVGAYAGPIGLALGLLASWLLLAVVHASRPAAAAGGAR